MCFFSIGTQWSRELVPVAAAAGAVCVDKSSAFRLEAGIPLVVPEVNGERALEHTGIVANPNCCTIPLTMVLAPLHDAAGLRQRARRDLPVRLGRRLRRDRRPSRRGRPTTICCAWTGSSTASSSTKRSKLREETRKILELPELPVSATCVRVPVVVGHAEAVWIETETPLAPDDAERILARGAGSPAREGSRRTGTRSASTTCIVGRVRPDQSAENGLALFLVCDNLRKGAALNAIQIAELLVGASLPSYFGQRPASRRPAARAPARA